MGASEVNVSYSKRESVARKHRSYPPPSVRRTQVEPYNSYRRIPSGEVYDDRLCPHGRFPWERCVACNAHK